MDAKAKLFILLFGIFVLLAAGCPEATLPGSDSPSLSDGSGDGLGLDDPQDSPTNGSITGHLTITRQAADKDLATEESKANTAASAAQPDNVIPGELLVTFEPSATQEDRTRILAEQGMREIEHSPSGVSRVWCVPRQAKDLRQAKLNTLDDATKLVGQPGIRGVSANRRRHIARVPDDGYFPVQWNYPLINLPEAWDITTGSDDIVVAVVDTGILSNHPDLAGRLVSGYDFVSDPDSARDGDGRDANPEDPGDQYGGPGNSSFHGTHVAGTIGAATNNGTGVAGITWAGKIMPVRALGKDGGTSFDLAEAIRFAAGLPNVSGTVPAKPARIINLSVAGDPGEPAAPEETAAITAAINAGVLVVAAAGNENSSLPAWPAAQPEVISVGAVDAESHRASYSNYGSSLDLAAPGGQMSMDSNTDGYPDGVLSTCASDAGGGTEYEYVFSNGTSMACPHVAGVAALVMAVDPALTAAQVRSILETTASDLGPAGRDDEYGNGLVDAAAAVREALRLANAENNTSPVLSLSTTTLDFGVDFSEFRVRVTNAGGGYLTVSSISAQEIQGSGWLHAEGAGSSETCNVQDVVITVTRDNLADGTYNGTVTVNADGLAPATISVSLTTASVPQASETIYVVAVRAGTLAPVVQTQTSADVNFAYHLGNLPPGDYQVYASTDRNGDGFIGDAGDLCGALPVLSAPQTIGVQAGDRILNMDFAIDSLPASGEGVSPLHIQLLE